MSPTTSAVVPAPDRRRAIAMPLPRRRLAVFEPVGHVCERSSHALAWWNSAVAVLFGVAALTWVLAQLYWRSQGGDIYGERDRRD